MRLKSAYRTKLADNNPAEASTPDIPERVQASERAPVDFTVDNKAEPAIAVVSADEYPQPDEATLTLQKQIADLKKSEELQREYALHVAAARAQPPTREQKLAMWRQQGADEGDLEFLEQNPAMVDMYDLTRAASGEAEQQGYERGTDAHREATKEIFHRHLGHQPAQPAASVQPAAADPAGFFRPEPSRSPAAPDRSAIVSAPVSRSAPGGYREPSPRQVKLSPLEQEIARNLGLSDVAYAEGKIRLQRAKANGDLQ